MLIYYNLEQTCYKMYRRGFNFLFFQLIKDCIAEVLQMIITIKKETHLYNVTYPWLEDYNGCDVC